MPGAVVAGFFVCLFYHKATSMITKCQHSVYGGAEEWKESRTFIPLSCQTKHRTILL